VNPLFAFRPRPASPFITHYSFSVAPHLLGKPPKHLSSRYWLTSNQLRFLSFNFFQIPFGPEEQSRSCLLPYHHLLLTCFLFCPAVSDCEKDVPHTKSMPPLTPCIFFFHFPPRLSPATSQLHERNPGTCIAAPGGPCLESVKVLAQGV